MKARLVRKDVVLDALAATAKAEGIPLTVHFYSRHPGAKCPTDVIAPDGFVTVHLSMRHRMPPEIVEDRIVAVLSFDRELHTVVIPLESILFVEQEGITVAWPVKVEDGARRPESEKVWN